MDQHQFNQIIVNFIGTSNLKEISLSHLNLSEEEMRTLVKNASGVFRNEKEVETLGHPKTNVENKYFYVIEKNGTYILGRMYGLFVE